jgi:cell division protease FtsH
LYEHVVALPPKKNTHMIMAQAPALASAKSSLDEFIDSLYANQIGIVDVDRSKSTISYLTDSETPKTVTLPLTDALLEEIAERDVLIRFDKMYDVMEFLARNATSIIFLALISVSLLMQRAAISKQSQFFGASAKKQIDPEDVKVKFEDVAGLENAKLELFEVVEFLKTPAKFLAVGAKIPKGCLLTGGPGLGKTLLAKAVAGEAGVPFFACSASEFVEMFVGVGAARIRDLFKNANAVAPCIVFIDEIDAIGRSRTSGNSNNSNDEREQTINQLLTEMDGFSPSSGVVVLAATNRPDILDKALVRPGRFDRQIDLEPPTLLDRERILEIHCKTKPTDDSVSLAEVAKNTVGLSGAELANIANEAAIFAARRDSCTLSQEDFAAAIDRVLLGPEKKSSYMSDKKKRVVACHEAGHTIVALMVGEYDAISKVSIVPRGKAAGVTVFQQLPDHADIALYTRRYLENKLVVALGGRAAEEIIFGEYNTTTGAVNDMEVVQQLARAMVVDYGFSAKLGPASWQNSAEHSLSVRNQIDKEVMALVQSSYKRAKILIQDNFPLFDALAESLYNKEVLDRKDIDALLKKRV